MTGNGPMIVAALCWYDEPPASLERCISSLAGFADLIVSLDGPYADYPGEGHSPDNQRRALARAARMSAIPHLALQQIGNPTQGEKRTYLYRHAAHRAGYDGWILIIDADEELDGDYSAARSELERDGSGFDAATVNIQTGSALAPHPRLIRGIDGLTCGPEYHGMLSATGEDGRRICIRDRREIIMGENPRPRRAREIDMGRFLTIHNHTNDRPDDRKAAKREYVTRRTQAGIDL